MKVQRMAFVVDFHGKEIPKKLNNMDVNLVYVSKHQNYAIIYADAAKGLTQLAKQLQPVKGFKSISESLFFDPNKNI